LLASYADLLARRPPGAAVGAFTCYDLETAAATLHAASISGPSRPSSRRSRRRRGDGAGRDRTPRLDRHQVANAGIYPPGALDLMSDADWNRPMDVNVLGVVHARRSSWTAARCCPRDRYRPDRPRRVR